MSDVEIDHPGRGCDPRPQFAELRRQGVIVFVQYYLPGVKAGGPIRSIANLTDLLGQDLSFKIVTSDRDLKDRLPYHGIPINHWMRVGSAEVMYISPGWRGLWALITLLRSVSPQDVLYINSFFSRRFSMLPIFLRWLGILRPQRVILAPRGEFSLGALGLKNKRKKLYLAASKLLRLYRGVIYHASSKFEALDISRIVQEKELIQVAEIIPSVSGELSRIGPDGMRSRPAVSAKEPGCLHLVFVSRICPMKNLLGALSILKEIDGDIVFDIYGPTEDTEYWIACQEAIAILPSNIQVKYHGVIEHDQLSDVFAQSDLFLLPTFGENYGHVICEAMSAGCPVLISDRTPWKNLEEMNAGWDVQLEDIARFRAIIKDCVDGDQARQVALSNGAQSYVRQRLKVPEILEANRKLFSPVDVVCS